MWYSCHHLVRRCRSIQVPCSPHTDMAHFPTSATLEPGDRFEVFRFDSTERIRLPKVLGPDGFPIEKLEDPAGVPMEVVPDPSSRSVVVPKLDPRRRPILPPRSGWSIRATGRFRLKSEAVAGGPADGERTTEQGVRIEFDARDRTVVRAERGRVGRVAGPRAGPGSRPAGDARRASTG